MAGQEFEFVKRRKNWQLDRVYYFDAVGELAMVPTKWTDVVAPEPFVVIASGKHRFGLEEPLAVSEPVTRIVRHRWRVPCVQRTLAQMSS